MGNNAAKLPNFCDRVTMYVFEEMIEGKKLTEIINEQHENVKYLPGHKLPVNVVSITLKFQENNLRHYVIDCLITSIECDKKLEAAGGLF